MFTFKATDDSGQELEFGSDSRDVANWERTHKGATFGQLGADEGRNLSWVSLYSIAFFAAKRQGLIGSMSEGEFNRSYALDLIEDEDVKADEDAPESPYGDAVTTAGADDPA